MINPKLIVAAGVLFGLAVGAAGTGFVWVGTGDAAPISSSASDPVPGAGVVPGSRGTNSSGQTFGQNLDPTFTTGTELVEAIASNGKLGYVYASELRKTATPAASPEAARAANNNRAVVIGVYLTDGVTRIGDFVMSPSIVTEIGAEK